MRTAPAMASAPICRCMKGRSASPRPAREKLLAGMILSNEPGYYREGAYGIRIENLILVTPAEPIAGRRHRHARLRDADAGARSTGG